MMNIDYTDAIAALQLADPILPKLIKRVGKHQLNQAQQTVDLFNALSCAIIEH